MDQSNELPPGGSLPGRGAAPAAAGAVHAAADAVHAAADAAPAAAAGEGHGHRGVALLLGTAAILAAIVGARASALSSDAGDAWQSALRTEVKRSASAIEDIRYLYQSELPIAIRILQSRLLVAELQSAAAAGGSTAQALTFEVGVQSGLLTAIEPSSDLAKGAPYALPSGGLDLGKRLADLRARAPDIVALDPDAAWATGDRLALHALHSTLAVIPVSIAALLGALAQPLIRRRRLLLALGSLALAAGAAVAVGAELLG